MDWDQVLKLPQWPELSTQQQAEARAHWVDTQLVPRLQKAGVSQSDIDTFRIEENQNWDNGVGAASSFGSAAAQGFLNTGTSAVQGAGVLVGSERLEQAGREMEQSVNETFRINPIRENINLAGNVAGNVAAFIGTGGVGGAVGRTMGAAKLGAEIGGLGTGFLAGAGQGAREADRYGITGPGRYARALGGGAVEVLSELAGGTGAEMAAIRRIPGLGGITPTRAGGFVRAVGTEAGEEALAQVGGNALTMGLASEGVQTPGLLNDIGQAAAGGALGGAMFGGIGLFRRQGQPPPVLPPPPSEQIARSAEQAALAAGDPGAAAIIRDVQPPMEQPRLVDIPNPLTALESRGALPEDTTLNATFDPGLPAPDIPGLQTGPVAETAPQVGEPIVTELPPLPADGPFFINDGREQSPPAPIQPEQQEPSLPSPDDLASQPPVIDQSRTPDPRATGDAVARVLRPAYDRLVARTGTDSVFISDLINESGLPAQQVKQWATDFGINQGQATLDTGDWSIANEEQRAANVPLRGQERLYIRLHPGVGESGSRRSAVTPPPATTAQPVTAPTVETATQVPNLKERNRQMWDEGATLLTDANYPVSDIDRGMDQLLGPNGDAWLQNQVKPGKTPRPVTKRKRLAAWVERAKAWEAEQAQAQAEQAAPVQGTATQEQPQVEETSAPIPVAGEVTTEIPVTEQAQVEDQSEDSAFDGPSVFDQHGRISVSEAQRMADAIRALGVTQANFVINDTGFPQGATDVIPGVKGQRVTDGQTDTIYLNRNEITADTPMHEVFHGLIPELRQLRPDLFNQGVAILQNSPALREIEAEYSRLGYTPERVMEEALATILGNESPAWLRKYSASAPWVQALMRWVAKVRVWLNDALGSRNIDPNMTLRQFAEGINRRVLAGQLRETGARMREAQSRTDLSILPEPFRTDINPNDQRIRQSGLAANQPGSPVWTMAQGISYQQESASQALEEAQRLYNEGQAQGFTFSDHYARLVQMIMSPGNVFNMTPGTYMGLMGQELAMMQADPDLHWTQKAAAAENSERLMELMASSGASGGQFIKGFDFGLRIMNDAFSQVENMSMRAAVGGEQAALNKFKGVVRSVRAIMAQFQQEGISNLTQEQAARTVERIGGRLVQGDEAGIAGEVAAEEALNPEIEQTEAEANVTDQDWFKAGVAQMSAETQALVDEWLITLEALSLKTGDTADLSITPAERSAKAAELARTMTRDQLKQRSEDLFKRITQQRTNITTPSGPQDVKGLVKQRLAKNLNRLLNGKAKGKKSTAEQIAATISNVLLAKAGRGNTVKAGPDSSIFAMGVILSNEQLARDSVAEIHAMLQANPATKDAISQKKLKGFMSLLAGKDFSAVNDQAAPFGERQIAQILRQELAIQNTTLSQSTRTAALQGLTAEQLEANLRDPFRGLTEAFEPAVLDRIVSAVKAEYAKSGGQRAAEIAARKTMREAEGRVRMDMRRELEQDRRWRREQAQAQERIDRQAQREGESEAVKAMRLEMEQARKWQAEQRRLNARNAQIDRRERRDQIREDRRAERLKSRLARQARVRLMREGGQGAGGPAPRIERDEIDRILAMPGNRAINYLSREFGLETSDIRYIRTEGNRRTELDSRVSDLADQLGLTSEETARLTETVGKAYEATEAEISEREASEEALRAMRAELRQEKRSMDRIQREQRKQRLKDVRDRIRQSRRAEQAALSAEREAEREWRKNRIERMKRGEFVPDIGSISEEERRKILRELPKNRVIDYLSREFGFNISDLVDITRPGDRQATIEQRTLELADQLGLTREQAAEIIKTVSAEGMKTLDARRRKEAEKQIKTAMEKLEGTAVRKARKQPTAVERLQRLMNLGGLEMENIEKVLLNSVEAQEFSPEFKAWLRDMLERSNDPTLPQTTRDRLTMTINTAIRSAKGASLIGLLGEWTMSNIFFAVSTFKVNAFWGGVKAISDSAIYAGNAIPRNIRNEYGIETRGLGQALFRQAMRSYTRDLQYHASYLFRTGRSALESDYTTRFTESEFELLAAMPDTPIRKWLNGEPISPFWAKGIKALAGMNKYVRRTMVATDLLHRSQAHEMLKAGAIVKLIAEQGGQIPNTAAAWTKAIDDAMYGGDFELAKREAYRKADNDIAAGKAEPAQRGLLFGEYLDQKLGESLGISDTQRREILDDTVERAKRWTNADQTQGWLGLISNKLMETARDVPGVRYLLPAIRMPINAFSQGLDWSPYAYLRYLAIKQSGNKSSSVTNYMFNRDGAKKSWHMPAQGITNEQAIELRTKAHLGTSMMIVLFLAAALDWDKDDDEATFYITGKGPTDPQQAKLWRERGYRPFMIRIGGVTANYQESPAYAPLAVLGATSDANRYGKPEDTTSDKLAYAITKSMGAFAEAAVLRNLNDVLSGVTGSQSYNPKQAGQWTSRLAGVVIAPRIGNEINTILWGPQSNRDLSWGARALANVPFVPALTNKPAINFFGEEIHAERGMAGEVMPLVYHRISPTMLNDGQMSFVAKMGAAPLQTRRRFKANVPEKGGIQVMEDYDTMRKWATESGKALRKWLTPQVMERFRRQFAQDREQAEKDFDSAVREIRENELRKIPTVQF